MATVVFVLHSHRAEARDLVEQALHWLEARGHQAVIGIEPDVPDSTGTLGDAEPVDVAVSLGGDGTMLRTVAWAAPRQVPVLGVNLGRLGYLTEVEPSRLEWALQHVVEKTFAIERRMMLEVTVTGAVGDHQDAADAIAHLFALNEAVVEKTDPGHTVRLEAGIGGQPFVTYAADGLLVATPTGSTAYNLSARGPIVSPRLRAMVVTPLSPHMLFDRAMVLGPDEDLSMTVAGPRDALLVVDGASVGTLAPGTTVTCKAAAFDAQLVVFGHRDFHAIVRSRFALTDR